MEIDIVKDHTKARVELAASEDTWQQRVVNIDVAQSEVLKSDFRISVALDEGVQ